MLLEAFTDWLTFSSLIERPAFSGFGNAAAYTTIATVPCHIRALNGGEAIDYGGVNVRSTHRVIMNWGVDISESDRITIDGKQYNVRFVDAKKAGDMQHLQVDVEYIEARA